MIPDLFWYLLLAHFIADYPLQPDWMVMRKTRPGVLLLHVSVHFVVMALVTFSSFLVVWPYLLTLTAIHFGIDTVKNWFTVHKPAWIAGPYLVDQICHYLSIGLITVWVSLSAGPLRLPLNRPVVVYALGLLLVTYVWLITERILRMDRSRKREPGDGSVWERMFIRAGWLAVLILGWNALGSGPAETLTGLALPAPYVLNHGGARWVALDFAISLVVAVLVISVR